MRALRIGSEPGHRPLMLWVAGLVLVGLVLALGHVCAASPFEHADCPVCKTFHQLVVTLPQLAAVQLGLVVATRRTAVQPARRRTPATRRGRAPPRLSPV